MATQNWDDHDRSGKYTAIAMAKNYLDSCDQNGILFTIGDNDTFPLWYAQEIEGYRTDVKIVCTSLLMTDWYIDQMKMKTYKSDGLPISFNHQQYVADNRDVIIFNKKVDSRWDLKDFIEFGKREDTLSQVEMESGHRLHFFPTNKVRFQVNKNNVIANKIVNPSLNDSIVPFIDIDIKGGALYKNRLIMLDILNNNKWKRPIYFSPGSFGDDDYLWMKDYLQMDGMVYKLVPIKTPVNEDDYPDMGRIDTDKMYNLAMRWFWGNGESTKIYHDPETRRNAISYRTNLSRLTKQLITEGKLDKAKKIIDLAVTKTPVDYYGYYLTLEPFVSGYYEIGQKEKARELVGKLMNKYKEELLYYSTFSFADQSFMAEDIIRAIERYRSLLLVIKEHGDIELYNKSRGEFNASNGRFSRFQRENE
jgi:tetratricopeptide (TPR) repeat protein